MDSGDNFDIKTRSQVKQIGKPLLEDPKAILNNVAAEQVEARELIQDRIFHDFVENVVNPDQSLLENVEDDEFVPNDESVVEAEDGGSSEEEIEDDEEKEEGSEEDQEAVITEGQAANIQGVPSAMAAVYKKRFPNFWRTQQGLVNNLGRAYEQEDDPDFITADEGEEIEDVSSSDSSDDEDEDDFGDDEVVAAKGAEVEDLAVMVEDMAIPDENGDANDEIEEDDDDDEEGDVDQHEMTVEEQLAEDQLKDYKSDEDADYEPVEVADESSEHESELSSDDEDLSGDDEASEEEGDENMVE